jgi:hypothetical protein
MPKSVVKKIRTQKNKKDEKDEDDKQRKITEYYSPPKKCGYDPETECWHCIVCGENMGKTNSRQLCGKYYCWKQPDY